MAAPDATGMPYQISDDATRARGKTGARATDATQMSIVQATPRLFDLNIDEILEHWDVEHAIRELIANALDEHVLTGSPEPTVTQDSQGVWHVRDEGRGLQIDHFTMSENHEKLAASNVIGKFGVGLKDALATLHRRSLGVTIRSSHGTFTLADSHKHGFDEIQTLHVVYDPTPALRGTDVQIIGATAEQVARAREYFLHFADHEVVERTPYGSVLLTDGPAKIFINGVIVNEEPDFLFSYDITDLTPAMRKRLNRERSNVGRTIYADRVKAILRVARSEIVCEELARQVADRSRAGAVGEMQWQEVVQVAIEHLHDRKAVAYVTASEVEASPDAINHMRNDGYDVVVISDTERNRLEERTRAGISDVRTFRGYIEEYNASFEYHFIPDDALSTDERACLDQASAIAALVGIRAQDMPPIGVSETMRVGSDTTLGAWDHELGSIVIARRQLESLAAFTGTLLHELAHATTGTEDVSRAFENVLTRYLGQIGAQLLRRGVLAHEPVPEAAVTAVGTSPYVAYLGTRGYPDLARELNRIEARLRRSGRIDAATRLSAGVERHRARLIALAREVASEATQCLWDLERETRQPDGRVNYTLLSALLSAEPVDEHQEPGVVGLARRDSLNAQVPGWVEEERVRGFIALARETCATRFGARYRELNDEILELVESADSHR